MILFSTISVLLGQVPQFSHYSVSDGLSQSQILCIFQDSEGYTWFGTQNGLNRFDGYSFEKFFNDPAATNTISSNWIFDIAEDLNGVLWIGTKGGLNKYDKFTNSFQAFVGFLPFWGNKFSIGIDNDKYIDITKKSLFKLKVSLNRLSSILTYAASIKLIKRTAKKVLVGLHQEDSGQDLIEYALIAALIALAATFGMGTVAKAINDAFSSIGAKLGSYTA